MLELKMLNACHVIVARWLKFLLTRRLATVREGVVCVPYGSARIVTGVLLRDIPERHRALARLTGLCLQRRRKLNGLWQADNTVCIELPCPGVVDGEVVLVRRRDYDRLPIVILRDPERRLHTQRCREPLVE